MSSWMVWRSYSKAYKRRYKLVDRKLAKQRNSLVPIHQLPLELLLEILELSAQLDMNNYDKESSIDRLMDPSTVSTHWWETLASASHLWARIHSRQRGVRLALVRSRDLPLEIMGPDRSTRTKPSNLNHNQFARLLALHAGRWKFMTWEEDWGGEVIAQTLSTNPCFLLEKPSLKHNVDEEQGLMRF